MNCLVSPEKIFSPESCRLGDKMFDCLFTIRSAFKYAAKPYNLCVHFIHFMYCCRCEKTQCTGMCMPRIFAFYFNLFMHQSLWVVL